jgi:proteasome activator subunit 4
MFRLWEAVNSYAYDERMLHFLSRLAEMHVDPTISTPKRVDEISVDWEDGPQVKWPRHDLSDDWRGLYRDVGMFSDDEWSYIMCKCLISMGR